MPIPIFKKGFPFLDQFSAARMNALAKAASNGVVSVSGALSMVRNGDGVALHVPTVTPPEIGRCYVLTASSPIVVSGGAAVSFDSIGYDIPEDKTTFLIGILASGVFTFQSTGIFIIHYSAVVSVDIGAATSTTVVVNTVKTFLAIGGTDATKTEGRFSAIQKPNFKDFLKVPEGETLSLKTDLSALTMVSAVVETAVVLDGEEQPTLTPTAESDALSGGNVEYGGVVGHLHEESEEVIQHVDPTVPPVFNTTTASNALSGVVVNAIPTATVITNAAILNGEGMITVVMPEGADPFPIDDEGTGFPDQLPDGLPTGVMFGTTSGSAMINVTQDETGGYRIEYNGAPDLPPTISLKGGRYAGGSRPLTVESATMTITRIATH